MAQVEMRERLLKAYGDIGDIDLKEALLDLWRRKWLILFITLLFAGVTVAVLYTITPRFTASVKLVFEKERINLLPGLINQTPATEQVEVITSRVVAERVIDRLGLRFDPEFNAELRPEPASAELLRRVRNIDFSAWLSPAIGQGLEILQVPEPERQAVPPAITDQLRERLLSEEVLDAFLGRLKVGTLPQSNVIDISFDSEQPEKAASIADAIASSYLEQRLEAKFEEIQRSSNWLDGRIEELRTQVQMAETTLEEYRRRTGLMESTRGGEGADRQVAELNTQLILARTERAEREARRDQVRRMLQAGPDGLARAVEVLNSALVNNLVAQEVELNRRVADLRQVYGSRHPQLINAQAELEDLRVKIRQEAVRVAAGLDAEVNVARERERLLEQGLRGLEATIADTNEASVTLRALERDATAARNLLETFLEQSQQLRTQDDIGSQRADATIISAATIPRFPTYPRRTLSVAAAIVVGLVLGVILALLLERFDAVYRSAEQIEEDLGLPVFAGVPDLRKIRTVRKRGLATYLLEKPSTAAAEAVRAINARMLLQGGEIETPVIQFVSAEPEEGKSSLAIACAQMHAKGGRRVLLIDADFRQSSVAKTLGIEAWPGLTEVMAKQVTLEAALRTDPATGAQLLTTGRFMPQAHDMIIGGRLDEVLKWARGRFDLVILDSPPVLSLTDSSLIAAAADRSIMVCRWGRTRKKTVLYALKQLTGAGATVMGMVLSFVDVKRAAAYSYGDAERYGSKHQKYYLDKA